MEKRLRAESWGLTQASNVAAVLPAPEAAVVGLQLSQERNLDVFDLATGKLVSVVQIPFRKARVAAISADARRLILGTDQLSLLVVDFPQGLPPGTIDLAKVLGKMKLPATR